MKRVQIHPRKKQKIFERDNFTCQICGSTVNFNALEVDHIIPVINGGKNDNSNLQTLCYKCNMKKRFPKDTSGNDYDKFSPLEKLKLIKDRLKEYKDLSYPEFKVVFTQDELFKKLRLDLLYINDLFYEISNNKKGESDSKSKYIKQRDVLINIIRQESGKSFEELSLLFKNNDIKLSFQQISKICARFTK